ncbi:high mobility group box domain-containing protein, partial [Trametes elegans]
PRPPNAWMIYRTAQRILLKAEHPQMHERVVSRLVATMWAREPPAVRDRYQRDADRAKEEHARRFPGYKYTP